MGPCTSAQNSPNYAKARASLEVAKPQPPVTDVPIQIKNRLSQRTKFDGIIYFNNNRYQQVHYYKRYIPW